VLNGLTDSLFLSLEAIMILIAEAFELHHQFSLLHTSKQADQVIVNFEFHLQAMTP